MEAQALSTPPRKRPIAFHVAGLALVGAAVLGVFAVSSKRHGAEAKELETRKADLAAGPRVQVAPVVLNEGGKSITLVGEVNAMRHATLYAKVSGYLRDVRVDKGQKVHAGDILGVLESPETEQDVLAKEADLANKKLVEQRYKSLAPHGLVTQQEMDKAQADLRIAQSESARVLALKGYQVIKAPYDGVVTARFADPGALLQAATSSQSALPLVEVSDISKVRVRVFLAQSEALFAHEGDPVTIWTDEFPDRKIKANITRFSRELDPRTRTMLTEIEVDNSEGALYPGVFVRVQLKLATPPAIAMPADAVVYRSGKPFVFVVKDGRSVLTPVQVGDTDGKLVKVREGVQGGDTVIPHPGDDILDGAPVQVVEKPAPQKKS